MNSLFLLQEWQRRVGEKDKWERGGTERCSKFWNKVTGYNSNTNILRPKLLCRTSTTILYCHRLPHVCPLSSMPILLWSDRLLNIVYFLSFLPTIHINLCPSLQILKRIYFYIFGQTPTPQANIDRQDWIKYFI